MSRTTGSLAGADARWVLIEKEFEQMSKDSRPSRREALLGDRPGSYAIARQVRMSPTKVRRVVDMIRGMDVEDALSACQFAPQAASEPVYKVIASAASNAERADNLKRADLYVSQAFVDQGVTIRRIRPRARGGWGHPQTLQSHHRCCRTQN
jgi:large subunit ribosomal protein L22